jgi:methyl coenzyme M reductase alpha subunit
MDLERIAKLETQVDGIKEDVTEVKSEIKELHSRITTGNREIVDKMDDMQTRIEHRLNASAVASKEQHESIKKNIKEEIRDIDTRISTQVKDVDTRVSALERWKWIIVGASVAIGYIIGNLDLFAKIFMLK